VTLTLFESIQRIVREELAQVRAAELAVVEEQHPHASDSDTDNYACTVKLRDSQLNTVLTRSNDVFIPLDNRVELGNEQKNSIFVSIHFNDSGRRGVSGFETYYHSPYAFDLAAAIERSLSSIPGTVDRGVHTARFRVLRNAHYPSVLVECGYLSNRSEARDAADAEYREQLADKIAEAIVDYRYGGGVYRRQPAKVARASGGGSAFLPSFR